MSVESTFAIGTTVYTKQYLWPTGVSRFKIVSRLGRGRYIQSVTGEPVEECVMEIYKVETDDRFSQNSWARDLFLTFEEAFNAK